MIRIILDSSNTMLLVAIAKDNNILESIYYEAWQQQSEFMIPELDKLLTKYNIERHDINEVIVSKGPGSFTGVRIAITIAKIIGISLNVPVIALSSLQILEDTNNPSICLINARSNRSYIGVYNGTQEILKDQIMTNDEVNKYIASHSDYKVMGDVSYLGLQNQKTDISKTILELARKSEPLKDVLTLKPVYLKDNYA